jgi:uncharacterized membrane protein HdeD (DUF308 family)
MSVSSPALTDTQLAARESVRLNWALFVGQGVIMVVLGVLAIVWPQFSTLAVDIFFGWLFLISGIVGLASLLLTTSAQGFLWSLLTAALSSFVGILLLWHPIAGAVTLTLALVALFIVEGVFQIASALRYRVVFPDSWGWMLASGAADLILAGLIIAGWPSTAAWVLGIYVGVNLLTSGIAIVMVALAGRSYIRMLASESR